MTTIQQTIIIPKDHRVTLELPKNLPSGSTAELVVTISPTAKRTTGKALSRFAGTFANSSTFSRDPLEIQRKLRAEW